MRTIAAGAPSARTDGWTPARVFMAVSAAYHLPLGIGGLIANRAFPVGSEAAERADSALIFGLFETNGWHSLAALLLGILGIYVAMVPRRAREVALSMGLFHVGIVISLFVWPPSTFWLASNLADQVIHSATALGGIASAMVTRPETLQPRRERTRGYADRSMAGGRHGEDASDP